MHNKLHLHRDRAARTLNVEEGKSRSPDSALTSMRVRTHMVERLQANGVKNLRLLKAMKHVPRHLFVDAALAARAYQESALPIGYGQTISNPWVVARMIELASADRTLRKVLEVGTGCGYQAAVLSQLADEVYSVERVKPLFERAKHTLRSVGRAERSLRLLNLRLHYGDGCLGLSAAAPFDAILIAAAGTAVPKCLLEQLEIGGRLVAPIGEKEQVLTLIERTAAKQWRTSRLEHVLFVPLKSGVI